MATFRIQRWEGDATGLSRRDRQAFEYAAYIPDALVGRPFVFDADTATDVAEAEAAITLLQASEATFFSMETIARLLLRAESVASSRIEGLQISARRLLRAEAARAVGEASDDVTATEVLANIDAMQFAQSAVGKGDARGSNADSVAFILQPFVAVIIFCAVFCRFDCFF